MVTLSLPLSVLDALSLAYAQKHPDRVHALILRGIFLCRPQEFKWFYQEGASRLFPDYWQDYLAPIPVEEQGDLMQAFYKRLTGADQIAQMHAAKAWSCWEGRTATLRPNPQVVEQSAHYGIEQGFTVPMHEPGRTFGSMHLAAPLANKAFVPSIKAHQLAIKVISDLAHHNRPHPSTSSDSLRLTPRENEFLRWLSMGKTYREIGLIMNISERTVKFYAHQMTEKLECVNVKQAMMKAMYLNLV